jgi:hypothetical protein
MGVQSGLIADANIILQGVGADQLRLHSKYIAMLSENQLHSLTSLLWPVLSDPWRTSSARAQTITVNLDGTQTITAIAAQVTPFQEQNVLEPSLGYCLMHALQAAVSARLVCLLILA